MVPILQTTCSLKITNIDIYIDAYIDQLYFGTVHGPYTSNNMFTEDNKHRYIDRQVFI